MVKLNDVVSGSPLLFFHAMHYATFLKQIADDAEYKDDYICELIDLLNLQRLSITFSGYAAIDKLTSYLGKYVLTDSDGEEFDDDRVESTIPTKFYDYLHLTLLEALLLAQAKSSLATVSITAYNPVYDYWVGLVVPKYTSGGKVEDFIRIDQPMVCLNVKDFSANFFFLEQIIGLAPNTHEYCAFYFIGVLKEVFSCRKDLKIILPRDLDNFFIFIDKFKHEVVGSKYTCPLRLSIFFDDLKTLVAYTKANPTIYGVYMGTPLAVRKLEQLCNYCY